MLFILFNFPIKTCTFPSALCHIFPLNVCAQSAVALCPTSGLCPTLCFLTARNPLPEKYETVLWKVSKSKTY